MQHGFVTLHMATIFNTGPLQKIGELIKKKRKAAELEIEDVAEITQLHYNTVKAMEEGGNSTLDNFISVAFALKSQPKDFVPDNLKIISKGKLSAARQEKTRLTQRINKLYSEDYFKTAKYTADVQEELNNSYGIKAATNKTSVILSRLVEEEKLEVIKVGNKNTYQTAKKKKK